jgi:dTDP-4-amino-4,6-dideoxygalactose transaminase
VGIAQLCKLDRYVRARRDAAALLTDRLRKIEGITPPYEADYVQHSYYKYIAALDTRNAAVPIADFVRAVRAEGIPVSRRYPLSLHLQPVFRDERGFGRTHFPFRSEFDPQGRGYHRGECPVAETISERIFRVIIDPGLSEQDIDDIAVAIARVASRYLAGRVARSVPRRE